MTFAQLSIMANEYTAEKYADSCSRSGSAVPHSRYHRQRCGRPSRVYSSQLPGQVGGGVLWSSFERKLTVSRYIRRYSTRPPHPLQHAVKAEQRLSSNGK